MAAVAGIVAGRISDRHYSHVLLDRQGYRPNPGLGSTPYYLAEAVLLTVVFLPGLTQHYVAALIGFAVGWLSFLVVLPTFRCLRFFPHLRREQWQAGEPIPVWAQG
jgi:hypothetical protein